MPPGPEHSMGQPDQPCGDGRAVGGQRPTPSSLAAGCCAGNACPSMVVEGVGDGPADEDACDAHPHHVEAAPRQRSGGWASEPTRSLAPQRIIVEADAMLVATAIGTLAPMFREISTLGLVILTQ
jgi:hypothetical protein